MRAFVDNTRDEAFSKRAIESLVLVREPTKVRTLEKLVSGTRRVFVFVLSLRLYTQYQNWVQERESRNQPLMLDFQNNWVEAPSPLV